MIMFVSCIIGGCHRPSLDTVPVYGTVTYDGKPIPYGNVIFQPVAGKGRPAVASIAEDGTYDVQSLRNARGLVPGKYNVSIGLAKPPGLPDTINHRVPPDLASQSMVHLELTVHSGDQDKRFDISLDKR